MKNVMKKIAMVSYVFAGIIFGGKGFLMSTDEAELVMY